MTVTVGIDPAVRHDDHVVVMSVTSVVIDGVERRVTCVEPIHGVVKTNLGLREDAPAIRAFLAPKEE